MFCFPLKHVKAALPSPRLFEMQRIGDHRMSAPSDTASGKRSLWSHVRLWPFEVRVRSCEIYDMCWRSVSRKLPKVWAAVEDVWLMIQLITCQILDSGVGCIRSAHGKGLRRTSVSSRCLRTSTHHSSLGDGRTNLSHNKSPLVSFKLFSHSRCHKDFTSLRTRGQHKWKQLLGRTQ